MKTDVIVLGGGIAGASTAYYLLKKGFNVAIVERMVEPDGATARSGGVVTRMQDNPSDIIYAVRALKIINDVAKDSSIVHSGYLSIISEDYLEDDLKRFRRAIPDIQVLYPSDIVDRWPYIKVYEGEVGLYSAKDVTIEPDKFLFLLWERIKDLGGIFLNGRRVRELVKSENTIRGVMIDHEILYGENIVSCLGSWTKYFMKPYGVKIKTYLLSIPIFKFKVDIDVEDIIGLWDDEAYGYWRPSPDAFIVGGGYDGYIIKNPEEGFNKPRKESYILVKDIFKFRYNVNSWRIVDAWTGTVSFTYSRKPLIIRCKKYKNLYIIDGLGGEGLIRGPGLAYEVAEMIKSEASI